MLDRNSRKALLLIAERVLDGCRQLESRIENDGLREEHLAEMRRLAASAQELGHLIDILMATAQEHAAGRTAPRLASPSQVLVVDDDAGTRKALTTALRMADLDVVTASNGVEALVVAHNLRPALIIMDIAMPTLGGVEATRLLKASAHTRSIPVIAHTGKPEECDSCEPMLFACVLSKPIDPDVLLPIVSHFVIPRMLD